MTTDPALRVLARVDLDEPGCWIWPGSTTSNGYGTVAARPPYVAYPRPLLVHRVMYQYFIEDVPDGLDLDHLCRNRLCCNPVHVEPVTRLVNSQRGAKYRPIACVNGHPYPENMGINRKGHAWCMECSRIKTRARKRGIPHGLGKNRDTFVNQTTA